MASSQHDASGGVLASPLQPRKPPMNDLQALYAAFVGMCDVESPDVTPEQLDASFPEYCAARGVPADYCSMGGAYLTYLETPGPDDFADLAPARPRAFVSGPGFVSAVACTVCGHTRCGPTCLCASCS